MKKSSAALFWGFALAKLPTCKLSAKLVLKQLSVYLKKATSFWLFASASSRK